VFSSIYYRSAISLLYSTVIKVHCINISRRVESLIRYHIIKCFKIYYFTSLAFVSLFNFN
ncbi:hypothetical protein C0J52_06026, partial [Blattella germanica]